MLKIYNKSAITKKERFQNAIVVGVVVALLTGIAYGVISSLLRINFQLIYVGVGYVIGQAILKYGKGVQKKFSILAAVLCVVAILIGDFISVIGIGNIFNIQAYSVFFSWFLSYLFGGSVNGLLGLLFRVVAVSTAYQNARIS